MPAGVPAAQVLTCPRCKIIRSFVNVDTATLYRCSGCEWYFSLSATAPTGTATAAVTAGVTTAITVASGGASFTSSMFLLFDAGVNAEVVKVTATGTATNIPVAGKFIRNHAINATFGQLLVSSTLAGAGQAQVPNAPGWGF